MAIRSLYSIAFNLKSGEHSKLKSYGPDLKLDPGMEAGGVCIGDAQLLCSLRPVFVKPSPRRNRFKHLLVATNCVLSM